MARKTGYNSDKQKATAGIHAVEILHTAAVEIKPEWARDSFKPGESWSHALCQIRVA